MLKEVKGLSSDRTIWFLVGAVFLCVILVLIAVFNHDREKPKSPQALAAAAFNQAFTMQEWKPGMGKKPFLYHPAGFNQPVWKPLPVRTPGPAARTRNQGGAFIPGQFPMNRNGSPFPDPGMP